MSRQRKRSESYKARRTVRKLAKIRQNYSEFHQEDDIVTHEQWNNYNDIVAAGLRHHG
jgi:hypothetical protein